MRFFCEKRKKHGSFCASALYTSSKHKTSIEFLKILENFCTTYQKGNAILVHYYDKKKVAIGAGMIY
ncbi:MAG: hypothetical protein J6R49_04685, partial [Clostridia bacterium]|nr:hypothetical protein [Clostridia bacterium]